MLARARAGLISIPAAILAAAICLLAASASQAPISPSLCDNRPNGFPGFTFVAIEGVGPQPTVPWTPKNVGVTTLVSEATTSAILV